MVHLIAVTLQTFLGQPLAPKDVQTANCVER